LEFPGRIRRRCGVQDQTDSSSTLIRAVKEKQKMESKRQKADTHQNGPPRFSGLVEKENKNRGPFNSLHWGTKRRDACAPPGPRITSAAGGERHNAKNPAVLGEKRMLEKDLHSRWDSVSWRESLAAKKDIGTEKRAPGRKDSLDKEWTASSMVKIHAGHLQALNPLIEGAREGGKPLN